MLERYYQVLGVSSSASLDEIKKAFKRRARELHPDVNKAADAHEQFILLNEAYQYLQNLKTGKIYSSRRRSYTSSGTYGSYEDYAKKEREEARKRAEFYARKRYSDFRKSAYYKRSMEIQAMANQILIVFYWSIIIGLPTAGYLAADSYGFYAALAILFFASPRIIPDLRSAGSFNFSYLKKGIIYLARHPLVQLNVLIAAHLVIFFTVVLNTLVNPLAFAAAYISVVAAGWILSGHTQSFSKGRKKALFIAGLSPSVVSLFFLLNYLVSFNPVDERYNLKFRKEYYSYGSTRYHRSGGRWENTTLILLEGNKYEEFPGIRIFVKRRPDKVSEITYTIADGIFGLRVVKEYTFSSPWLRKRMRDLAE